MQTKFSKFRSLHVLTNCRVKFRKISCEKFHCQAIFRAKFQGNIARYFRRTNEKSPFRKFAEAKFCVATNKLMSSKMNKLHTETKFRAKSFTAKRYFERNFKEISLDISEGQTKNRHFENSQKRNFAWQLTN